jgi:hypothetical protein
MKYSFDQRHKFLLVGLLLSLFLKESISTLFVLLLAIHSVVSEEGRERMKKAIPNRVSIWLFVFFTPYLYAVFFGYNDVVLENIVRYLPFVILPLFFAITRLETDFLEKVKSFYLIGMILLTLYGIGSFAIKSFQAIEEISPNVFSELIRFHATTYSFMVMVAVVILLENNRFFSVKLSWYIKALIFALFIYGIFIAQGRLMILMLFLYLGYFIFQKVRKIPYGIPISIISFIAILAISGVAISKQSRFNQFSTFSTEKVFQETYTERTPLNSIAIRPYMWRLAVESMSSASDYIFGVGHHNSLHRRFKRSEEIGASDYVFYRSKEFTKKLNNHNQYIESFFGGGLIQFTAILVLLFLSLSKAVLLKEKTLIWIFLLISFFFITESVLLRSKGMIFFLYFTILVSQLNLPQKSSQNTI